MEKFYIVSYWVIWNGFELFVIYVCISLLSCRWSFLVCKTVGCGHKEGEWTCDWYADVCSQDPSHST